MPIPKPGYCLTLSQTQVLCRTKRSLAPFTLSTDTLPVLEISVLNMIFYTWRKYLNTISSTSIFKSSFLLFLISSLSRFTQTLLAATLTPSALFTKYASATSCLVCTNIVTGWLSLALDLPFQIAPGVAALTFPIASIGARLCASSLLTSTPPELT